MERRRAPDRRGCGVHVQLHHRQRPHQLDRLHAGHRRTPRPWTTPPCGSSAPSPRPTCCACTCPSCRSTSGRRSRARRRRSATRTSRRSSAPGRSRASSGRRTASSSWSPTRATGAAPPRSTSSTSSTTPTPTRWCRTSRRGPSTAPPDPRRPVPAAQDRARHRGAHHRHQRLRRARLQLLRAAASRGNPVLKDPKFRQALNWAVDRDKICAIVYGGHARPATTVITADYYTDPDWHWEPPADVKYSFDLEKAKQLLDAAGYKDTDGDGIREDAGKPIELRLWCRAGSTTYQNVERLVAGWFTADRPQDGGVGHGRRCARRAHPRQGRRQALARLRHRRLGLVQRPRPGLDPQLLHDRPDRLQQRLRLLRPAVRRALRRSRRAPSTRPRARRSSTRCSRSSTGTPPTSCWPTRTTSRRSTPRSGRAYAASPAEIGNVLFPPYGNAGSQNYVLIEPKIAAATAESGGASTGLWVGGRRRSRGRGSRRAAGGASAPAAGD